MGKTLEEVAQGYLTELVRRSLVQVSSITIDGQVTSCRVHDMIRMLILEKFKDLSFCKLFSSEYGSSSVSLSGMTRRLSITTHFDSKDLMASPHVRSLLFFINDELLSEDFVGRISTIYGRLKVLGFEDARLSNIPKNFGSLIHLKYLSIKDKNLETCKLPKSLGMLKNLETLAIRRKGITQIPKEIGHLRKLRHLVGSLMEFENGTVVKLTSLQTLSSVFLHQRGMVGIIRELGSLKQLRELSLIIVYREHTKDISSSINEMQHLEKLTIMNTDRGVVSDLHLTSQTSKLRELTLSGKLEKLPDWIPELQSLVLLDLKFSMLTDDPMKSLQNMQSLLRLSLTEAYEGETLHFQDGGFQKLKELCLENVNQSLQIIIDKGALPSLKKLQLLNIPNLKTEPTGMQHLHKLEDLDVRYLPTEIEKMTRFEQKALRFIKLQRETLM